MYICTYIENAYISKKVELNTTNVNYVLTYTNPG